MRAIDLVGNVSDDVSSDGFIIDMYPGPPSVVQSTPDSGSYLPLTESSEILIKFSEPISYYELVLESVLNFVYPYDEFQASDSLVITLEGPLASFDTIRVTLTNVRDLSGQVSDEMTYRFYSELLGDYTGDLKVDVSDLSIFIDGWTNKDYSLELGPVSGEVPHFVPEPDLKYDLRDVMVFTRMWYWSRQGEITVMLTRATLGSELEVSQMGRSLIVNIPKEVSVGQLMVQYPQASTDIRLRAGESTEERILLSKKDADIGQILVEFGYVVKKDEMQTLFDIEAHFKENSTVTITYSLFSRDGEIVSQGTKAIDLSAVPNEFALHQNYPNPFNPITTLSYDLPERSDVTLTVYDILGRKVRTLINEEKVAGYYSTVWDGRDSMALSVSTGVYVYHIHARGDDGGSYAKSYKMLLLK